MKNQIITTSYTRKLCLMAFIFLCSVFSSKKAFSFSVIWQHDDLKSIYFPDENAIDIKFLFYHYSPNPPNEHCFLRNFEILYSEDDLRYISLLKAKSVRQEDKGKKWMEVTSKKLGARIDYVNGKYDRIETSRVWFIMHEGSFLDGKVYKTSIYSVINLKWTLPKTIKVIKGIRIKGLWINDTDHPTGSIVINETYPMKVFRSKSHKLNDNPSVLGNDVKVTVKAHAIIVSGVKPGGKIKVYNAAGAEVTSVVAKDDVVSIELPKKQNYVVKVGEFSKTVTL